MPPHQQVYAQVQGPMAAAEAPTPQSVEQSLTEPKIAEALSE